MAFPTGHTVYTFAGISFTHILASGDFPPWFAPKTQYTADAVLGGTQVYLDIGGDSVTTLAIRASCLSLANRASLMAARKTTGTLANDRPQSAAVTLVEAEPIDGDMYPLFPIDLLFVLRPA